MATDKGKKEAKKEEGKALPAQRETTHQLATLWDRMNRLFADTFSGFDLELFGSWPRPVDVGARIAGTCRPLCAVCG